MKKDVLEDVDWKVCRFCSGWVVSSGDVCRTHEVVGCPECGRGALWKVGSGMYMCMNLDCDWASEALPEYGLEGVLDND